MLQITLLLILIFALIVASAKYMPFKVRMLKACFEKSSKEEPEEKNKKSGKKHFSLLEKVVVSIVFIIPEVIICLLIAFVKRSSDVLMFVALIYYILAEIFVLYECLDANSKKQIRQDISQDETKVRNKKLQGNINSTLIFLLFLVAFVSLAASMNQYEDREVLESECYQVVDISVSEYNKTLGSFDGTEETVDDGTMIFITIQNDSSQEVVMVNYEDIVFDLRSDTMYFEVRNVRSERKFTIVKTSEFHETKTKQEFVLHMLKDDLLSSYINE